METDSWKKFLWCTAIVLPQYFDLGLSGKILLTYARINLSQELLDKLIAKWYTTKSGNRVSTGLLRKKWRIETPRVIYLLRMSNCILICSWRCKKCLVKSVIYWFFNLLYKRLIQIFTSNQMQTEMVWFLLHSKCLIMSLRKWPYPGR